MLAQQCHKNAADPRKDFLLRRPEETQAFLGVPVSADGGLTEKANVIHFAQGARKFTGEKKNGGKTPETFFLKVSSKLRLLQNTWNAAKRQSKNPAQTRRTR